MTLLTIGSDRSLFTESSARRRIASYGALFDDLHIVVFTKRGFEMARIGTHIRVYPTNSRTRMGYIFGAYRRGRDIIRTLRRDQRMNLVISAQDPFESGLVAFLLSYSFGSRLHLQVHTDLFSPYFRRHSVLNTIRVWLARRLLVKAHCIRVVSERIKRSLVEQLDIPEAVITVLPIQNPETPTPAEKSSHETYSILLVARLEPEKAVDIGIAAFAEYVRQGGSGVLEIVGEGSERGRLEGLVEQFGISSRVRFRGWVEDLSPYYSGADCFLMPSWYEGWGVAAYDALRYGVPVVMTDVGLAGEAVRHGENGVIVSPGDAEGLARGLLLVEHDPSIRLEAERTKPIPPSFGEYLSQYRASFQACI